MAKDITPVEKSKQSPLQWEVLAAGGVIGALVGVGAAYLLLQAQDRRQTATGEEAPIMTTNGAVRLGLMVFGVLRQIGDLARGEK